MRDEALPRVLVACSFNAEGLGLMRAAGLEVDHRPSITQEEFDRIYHEYDAVVVRGNVRVKPVAPGCRLRAVVRAGSGLDNIAVAELDRIGVKVYNTPDAVAESVGELAVALMLSLARGVVRSASALSRGEWIKHGVLGAELMGKTLGIIGFGRIGRVVARIARGIGMKILVYDVVEFAAEDLAGYGAEQVGLEELLARSDFVTIHVPLKEDTRLLIGERELKMMKPTAYLVNTSRGGVVDEQALKRALREGWIAGAALDVFSEEPPRDLELLSIPNLIATPHIGAQTKEAQERASLEAARIVVEELGGRRPAGA